MSIARELRKCIFRCACAAATIALSVSAAHSQSRETAYGGGQSVWVGLDFSNMSVGFPYGSGQRMSGIGVFGVFNFNHRFAIQGESNFLRFNSYEGENQTSFLAGPRYTFLHSSKWRPYAQFSIGNVHTQYPFDIGSGNSFALSPAFGLDYRVSPRWAVQAKYEYQFLTNSPNFTNEPKFGMTPNGFSLGVSYRLHRMGK
jgi:hypothetical protein